jgi:hypothetical protein
MATALEFGSDALWLEKIIFRTSPVIDPATLAQRDTLTASSPFPHGAPSLASSSISVPAPRTSM